MIRTSLSAEWVETDAVEIFVQFGSWTYAAVALSYCLFRIVFYRRYALIAYKLKEQDLLFEPVCSDDKSKLSLHQALSPILRPAYALWVRWVLGTSGLKREKGNYSWFGSYVHWIVHWYFISGAFLITLFKPLPYYFTNYAPSEVRPVQSGGFILVLLVNVMCDCLSFLWTRYNLHSIVHSKKLLSDKDIIYIIAREIIIAASCFLFSQVVSNYFYSWHIGDQLHWSEYTFYWKTAFAPYVIYVDAANPSQGFTCAIPGQLIFSITSLFPSIFFVSVSVSNILVQTTRRITLIIYTYLLNVFIRRESSSSPSKLFQYFRGFTEDCSDFYRTAYRSFIVTAKKSRSRLFRDFARILDNLLRCEKSTFTILISSCYHLWTSSSRLYILATGAV